MFDEKTTLHLAELSKLNYSEEELSIITKEMDEIVALMDTVADFKSDNEGFVNDAADFEELRADISAPSLAREEILSNAKENNGIGFVVPKVV